MFKKLSKIGKYFGQTAKLMIGLPDYDNYVRHMRLKYPERDPMNYK